MMSSYRDLFSQACKQGLPPHEVQLLLEHLTALSRTALLLRMDDLAPDRLVQQLNELVQQRLTEPQNILTECLPLLLGGDAAAGAALPHQRTFGVYRCPQLGLPGQELGSL